MEMYEKLNLKSMSDENSYFRCGGYCFLKQYVAFFVCFNKYYFGLFEGEISDNKI